jgi:hypothetical protein
VEGYNRALGLACLLYLLDVRVLHWIMGGSLILGNAGGVLVLASTYGV